MAVADVRGMKLIRNHQIVGSNPTRSSNEIKVVFSSARSCNFSDGAYLVSSLARGGRPEAAGELLLKELRARLLLYE